MTKTGHLSAILSFALLLCLSQSCAKQEACLHSREGGVSTEIRQKEIATETYLSLLKESLRSEGDPAPSITSFESLKGASGDTVAYIANFNNNGFLLYREVQGKGYPIAFSTTSTMSTTDTIYDKALKSYIDNVIMLAPSNTFPVFDITDSDGNPVDHVNNYPRIEHRWEYTGLTIPYAPSTASFGQRHPYNISIPSKNLTGCLTTAIAQLLSHHKIPKYISGREIPWNVYLEKQSDFWSETEKKTLSLLFRNIYDKCITRLFGQSMGTKENGRDYLKKFFSQVELKRYDPEAIENRIIERREPVLMYGWDNFWSRHYWILDGYMLAHYDIVKYEIPGKGVAGRRIGIVDKKDLCYVHCNWGWNGGSNGYYDKKYFDTTSGPKQFRAKEDGVYDEELYSITVSSR